ncbi:hypothetical protein [Candidatus Phytoplasma asteris]|uniref:hypothetical protein n=1 Tax=Candidatus Phytoplasma asteris TaxID=85620 RepID=UPI003144D521
MQQEQLQQTPPLGEELKETNQTTETQQLTPEEIIKAKNLLEIHALFRFFRQLLSLKLFFKT